MSVVIDMNIPDNCYECPFKKTSLRPNGRFDICSLEERQYVVEEHKYEEGRPEWCLIKGKTAKRVAKSGYAYFTSGMTAWYECGECGTVVDPEDNYCRHCGRILEDER